MYMYTCTYTCTCTLIHAHIFNIHVHVIALTCCICTCTYIQCTMYMYMYMHMYTNPHTCTYTYTLIHTYISSKGNLAAHISPALNLFECNILLKLVLRVEQEFNLSMISCSLLEDDEISYTIKAISFTVALLSQVEDTNTAETQWLSILLYTVHPLKEKLS